MLYIQKSIPISKKQKVESKTSTTTKTIESKPAPAISSANFTCAGYSAKPVEDDIPIKKTKKKVRYPY